MSQAPPPVKPFRPRPRLFLILCIIWVLWMAALVAAYFTTVYPLRFPRAGRSPSVVPMARPPTLAPANAGS